MITRQTRPLAAWQRFLAAALGSAMLLTLALVGSAAPARAEEAPAAGASLTWNMADRWLGYINGPVGGAGLVTVTGNASGGPDNPFTWAAGTGTVEADDAASFSAEIDYTGSVRFRNHQDAEGTYELDQTLADPQISIVDGVGTISLDVSNRAYPGFQGHEGRMDFATFAVAGVTYSGDTATVQTSPVVLTAEANPLYSNLYAAGFGTIELTIPFTPPTPEPTPTTTTLAASPAGSSEQGTEVTLTATVSPAAAGSVTFSYRGSDAVVHELGSAPVSGGTAAVTTSTLPLGELDLLAAFTPADPAVHAPSTAAAVAHEVTEAEVVEPAPDAVATTTALGVTVADPAATPAVPPTRPGQPETPARSFLGGDVTLVATVTAEEGTELPVGTVSFSATSLASGEAIEVGTADVVDGVAELTTDELGAGGHDVAATFTPATGAFLSSVSDTATHRVVDVNAPAPYEPGPDAVVSDTAATASWDWSAYSDLQPMPWTKIADGDVVVNGPTFELSNGVVTGDAGGVVVQFTGTLRVQAYESFFPNDGQWVELVDPALHLTADGDGVWVAGVNTGTVTYAADPEAPRLVVGTFSGVEGAEPGVSGTVTARFDYADTTAAGTWSGARTSAWPNAFVVAVPDAIQSFYYASGAGGDANKPASDLTVDLDWPAVTTVSLAAAPGSRAPLGDEVTLTATLASSLTEGTVTFSHTPDGATTPVELGEAQIVDGVATWTTSTLAAGGHTFTASLDSSNGFTAADATTANYGIVDPAAPSVTAPTSGTAITDATASWDWSAYASGWTKVAGGDVTVEDGTFVLSGGTGLVGEDGSYVVDFTGTLRVEAYAGFFPPSGQWIELIDPTLTVDADGNGTWVAGVRSGVGTVTAGTAPRLVVGTITGADVPAAGTEQVETTLSFDYAGTTAPGTWSAGYADAWPNAFVLAAPSAVQAFYYASGAGGDANKPAADLALTFSAPAVTPEPEPEPEPEPSDKTVVTSGNLVWGIKESFRQYVVGPIAQGTITTSGGTTQDAGNGVFRWGGGSGSYENGTGSIEFTGAVTFRGHGGELDLTFADPVLHITGPGAGHLTMDVTGTDYAPGAATGLGLRVSDLTGAVTDARTDADISLRGVRIADVTFTTSRDGDVVTITGISSTLTAAGVPAFARFYDAGSDLDPIAATFALVASADDTPPVVPAPPAPPSTPGTPGGGGGAGGPGAGGTTPGTSTPVDPAAQCEARAVTGGTLTWGVRESFRGYITGPIANGSVTTSGVTANSDGTWSWNGGTGAYNPDDAIGRSSWSGSVSFTGHGGLLNLSIANPQVQLTGSGTANLVATVSSTAVDGSTVVDGARVVVATLRLPSPATSGSTMTWSGATATLTAAGAEAFAGFYSAGTQLDPVSFSLQLGGPVDCDTSSGTLPATGAETGSAALAAVGLMVLGTTAVVLRRRSVTAEA